MSFILPLTHTFAHPVFADIQKTDKTLGPVKHPRKKKVFLRDSAKKGCHAVMMYATVRVFPQSDISNGSVRALRKIKKESITSDVNPDVRTYFRFPLVHSHDVTKHSARGNTVSADVVAQIYKYVKEGKYTVYDVKTSLRAWLKEHKPLARTSDRAFYPEDRDLVNHIYAAKNFLKDRVIDQENLAVFIKKYEMEEKGRHDTFFRPFIRAEGLSSNLCISSDLEEKVKLAITDGEEDDLDKQKYHAACKALIERQFSTSLLLVHQEDWQRDLLLRFCLSLTCETNQHAA
jgi:hypothetical protein